MSALYLVVACVGVWCFVQVVACLADSIGLLRANRRSGYHDLAADNVWLIAVCVAGSLWCAFVAVYYGLKAVGRA